MVSEQCVEVSFRKLGGLHDCQGAVLGPGLQQGQSMSNMESLLRDPLAFKHGSTASADPPVVTSEAFTAVVGRMK